MESLSQGDSCANSFDPDDELGPAYMRAGLTLAGLPVEVVNTVISIQASFAAFAFDIVTGDVVRLGGRPSLSATCLLGA